MKVTGRTAQIWVGRGTYYESLDHWQPPYMPSESNLALASRSLTLFVSLSSIDQATIVVSECLYLQRQELVGERSFRATDSSLDVEVPIP